MSSSPLRLNRTATDAAIRAFPPETPSTSRAAQAPPEASEGSRVQDGVPAESSAEAHTSAAGSGTVSPSVTPH